ncbi:hypothetical protein [Methylobacterium aquaticum]|jgi:hypothetical protein|uniref:Uncharacterized protein n=1 Tax=Methylobacterium aquaticum TaxID=270351 RepID=A0A0J6SGU1_9HYPH|nr:hypothetical protein [Methylobacterium aquaticum]KMO32904.1 hypothetical protein VP06_16650 [Methylobacterium aquaticum]
MVSLTLALLTILPHRRAIVAGAVAFLSPAAKSATAVVSPLRAADVETVEAEPVLYLPAPGPVLALSAPKGSSRLLAAIEAHRSANLALNQAVRDYVQAEEDSAPDEALMLAVADRASDEEAAALNALVALTPASTEEAGALAAHFAEVSADFDKDTFSAWLFQRFAVMLARAAAQA